MNQQKGKGTQFFQLWPKEHDPANTSTPDVLLAGHDSIICTSIRDVVKNCYTLKTLTGRLTDYNCLKCNKKIKVHKELNKHIDKHDWDGSNC